jgi:hypothetical protein
MDDHRRPGPIAVVQRGVALDLAKMDVSKH